jgi:hypothetical protein
MATIVVMGCPEISLTTLYLALGDLRPRRTCTISLLKPAYNSRLGLRLVADCTLKKTL